MPIDEKKRVRTDQHIVTDAALAAELKEKQGRLDAFFAEKKIDALLLRRSENAAWATGGQVDSQVVLPMETGVASLLITRDGRRFYLAPKIEGPRLAAEEFANLDYEPVLFPWYEDRTVAEALRLSGGAVGTDTVAPGLTVVDIAPLRASLTPAEIARFRWLGARTAEGTSAALHKLHPGTTEFAMKGMVADEFWSQGIQPSVLLMAVDERILKFKHAPSRGATLQRYGMINLCTRRWGLVISITRFVHFGPMAAELESRFADTAQVNAAVLHATRAGATSGELFSVLQDAYSRAGYPGEEEFHHQGGACGYVEREWLATPGGADVVVNAEGFAWNPSIRGAKVEDTVLLLDGKTESVTDTDDLPIVETTVDGVSYRSAGVFVRD